MQTLENPVIPENFDIMKWADSITKEPEADLKQEDTTPVAEDEQEQAAEPTGETEEKTEEPEGIAFDQLTEEQRAQLIEELAPELKAEREKVASLEAEIQKIKESSNLQLSELLGTDNPYAEFKTKEELREAVMRDRTSLASLTRLVAEGEVETDDNGREGYNIGGNFYTKKQVAQEIITITEDLVKSSEQERRIEKLGKVSAIQEASNKELERYSWLSDSKGELAKKYEEVMQDSEMKLLEAVAPTLAARLPAFVAAWVNQSHTARKPLVLPTRKGGGLNSETTTGGRSSDTSPPPLRDQAAKRIRQGIATGNIDPRDVINAYFTNP